MAFESNLNSDGMMTVAFDCDGVFGDFKAKYLSTINELIGVQYSLDAVVTMRIEDSPFFAEASATYFEKYGVSKTLSEAVSECITSPGWCESMPAYYAAQESLKNIRAAMQKDGKPRYDIYCVTSPWDTSPTWGFERLRWLIKHFGFDRQHVVLTGAKHLIRADAFIEDTPDVLNRWLDAQTYHGKMGLLIDHPYNRNVRLISGGYRVHDWNQIENALSRHWQMR